MSKSKNVTSSKPVGPQSPAAPVPATAAPKRGDLVIDASALAGKLVDLPPGAMLGLKREQAGVADVLEEVTTNQVDFGDAAGIPAAQLQIVTDLTARLAEVRAFMPAARKLIEVLGETEATLEDQRETQLRAMAASIDAKVKAGNTDLLGKYEKTRAYRSANAVKAAKARKSKATKVTAVAKSA